MFSYIIGYVLFKLNFNFVQMKLFQIDIRSDFEKVKTNNLPAKIFYH